LKKVEREHKCFVYHLVQVEKKILSLLYNLKNIFILGGYFLAAGSSDSVIRVYSFHTYSPLKICELDRHTVKQKFHSFFFYKICFFL
jgi:hypothetical protein